MEPFGISGRDSVSLLKKTNEGDDEGGIFQRHRKAICYCTICWLLAGAINVILIICVLIPAYVRYAVSNSETTLERVYLMYPESGGTFQYQLTVAPPASSRFGSLLDISAVLQDVNLFWNGHEVYKFSESSRVFLSPSPMTIVIPGQVLSLSEAQDFEKVLVYSANPVPVEIQGTMAVNIGKLFNEPVIAPFTKSNTVRSLDNFTHPYPNVVHNCTLCPESTEGVIDGNFCLAINATGTNKSIYGTIFGQGLNTSLYYNDVKIGHMQLRGEHGFSIVQGQFPIRVRILIPVRQPTTQQEVAFSDLALAYARSERFNVSVRNFEFAENTVDWLENFLSFIHLTLHVNPAAHLCGNVITLLEELDDDFLQRLFFDDVFLGLFPSHEPAMRPTVLPHVFPVVPPVVPLEDMDGRIERASNSRVSGADNPSSFTEPVVGQRPGVPDAASSSTMINPSPSPPSSSQLHVVVDVVV